MVFFSFEYRGNIQVSSINCRDIALRKIELMRFGGHFEGGYLDVIRELRDSKNGFLQK
jgi:hypothetical protein